MRAMKTVKSNVRSSLCQRKEREKHMWGRAPSPVQPSAARRMIARRQCRSQQPLSPVRGTPKTFKNGQIPPAKPDSVGHAEICKHPLTSRQRGLALNYHLRSNSGSNGPIAKECHRFLVAGPFKCAPLTPRQTPVPALPPTPALPLRAARLHSDSAANRSALGLRAWPASCLLSAARADVGG